MALGWARRLSMPTSSGPSSGRSPRAHGSRPGSSGNRPGGSFLVVLDLRRILCRCFRDVLAKGVEHDRNELTVIDHWNEEVVILEFEATLGRRPGAACVP